MASFKAWTGASYMNSNSKFLLALHSSSEKFGVAIMDANEPSSSLKKEVFQKKLFALH